MAIFKIDIPGLYQEVDNDDLVFLSRVKVKILENIPDPLFGSVELATLLGLSPAQLSRRFKLLTSYSPSRMIKYFRMEYAMVLVKDTQMPLKEVTLNTGFLEQGNFTRTFKNHYGRSPSAVRLSSGNAVRSLAYQCQTPMGPEDTRFLISLCQKDNWFFELLQTTIEQIHFQDFNSTKLARLLSQSLSQLNRRIKAYLNITAGQFIKNIRLQQAAELLVYDQIPIGAVGYQVGFFDHPHFCRVFKEAFACSPSDFRSGATPYPIPHFIRAISDLNKIDK